MKVLVCVSNIKNAEKLIGKGSSIAQAFNGTCDIITVQTEPYDERNFKHVCQKKRFETLAEKYSCSFFYVVGKEKKITKTIANFVKEYGITHIVIGQVPRKKWDLSHETQHFVDDVFHALDDVDIHLVEVSPEAVSEKEYEKGIQAFISDESSNVILFERKTQNDIEGIFYKSSCTDFNNGIFRFVKNGEEKIVEILE